MQVCRLKKREDFLKTRYMGQSVVARSIVMQVLKKPEDKGLIRVGFTVTKKVSKKATERNRIKRRLKEVARFVIVGQVKIPCDVVIIGRKSALTMPFLHIKEDMKYAIRKLAKN